MQVPQPNSRVDTLGSWLSAISGATIAVFAEQFIGSISAFAMFAIRSLQGLPAMSEQFNSTVVVYGGISGLIESIVMIVLATCVIRQNDHAKKLILWMFPIFMLHSISFLGITSQLGLEIVRSIMASFILWVAFICITRAIKRA